MSIAYDLPGCMSDMRELDDSRDGSVPCSEATSRFKRIIASSSTSFRRALALAIPAALLPVRRFHSTYPARQIGSASLSDYDAVLLYEVC
jgi:hypothetical protein